MAQTYPLSGSQDPFVPPDGTEVTGGDTLLLESGVLRARPDNETRLIWRNTQYVSGPLYSEVIAAASSSNGGMLWGPSITNAAGTGYAIRINEGVFNVDTIVAYSGTGNIESLGPTINANDPVGLSYDPATGAIGAWVGGTEIWSDTDTTHQATSGLGEGAYFYRFGGTSSGIKSLYALNGAASSGIVSVNSGTVQGGEEATVTTIDFVPVSFTVGGLATSGFAADSATSYRFTMPPMAEGFYPLFGTVAVVGVDGDEEESSINVTLALQDGYSAVTISSLSSDISGLAEQMEAQHSFSLEVGGILYSAYPVYADTTFSDFPAGSTTVFYRYPPAHENYPDLVAINVVNGEVTGDTDSPYLTGRTLTGTTLAGLTLVGRGL
jgi:hypothetical protein